MKIALGADHAGFPLKEVLSRRLAEAGHEVLDQGTDSTAAVDYPDFAALVARQVAQDVFTRRGILICGSGAGVDITANKFKDIRSVLAANPDQAYLSRKDDDTNVLSLAAEFTSEEIAKKIISVWLSTPFSGGERYKRRIEKIRNIEYGN